MRRIPLHALVVLAVVATACSGTPVVVAPQTAPNPLATAVPAPARADQAPAAGTSRDPVVQVVEAVQPAVVNVTTDAFRESLGGLTPDRGVGTGFIVRSDGVIVTNCHVVEGASRITVITSPPNEDRYDARVIGADCDADLAVLKVEAEGLPTVRMGDSAGLQLGQQVVALGFALALEGGPTVTTGIVSSLDRVIEVQDPNCRQCQNFTRTYRDVIQTDAAINPGNSGGPLVDLSGRVVGINTAAAGQAENIGFAIAIDAAKPIIEQSMESPEAPVAYLGVITVNVDQSLVLQFNLPVDEGAYVVQVAPGGPAAEAGIDSGHVVVEFDGQKVTGADQLGELIRSHRPDDEVEVVVVNPGGATEQHTVTLGLNPGPST
jgi:S1-C subfamily serine protease